MQTARNIEGMGEMETQVNEVLDNVVNINRMKQFRQEIGLIADRSVRSKIISDESYKNYRQVVNEQEEFELSMEMVKSMRDFAKKHEDKAGRIATQIQRAKQEGVASDTDEQFLMSTLILDNEFTFAQNSVQIENLVMKKIANMRKDRKEYDEIVNNELVKNTGFIQISESEKLEVPDEKKFLAMKVPERREFLQKAKEALLKAEKHAEKVDEKESNKVEKKYLDKLEEYSNGKDAIIGGRTLKEYKKWISSIEGAEAKQEALDELHTKKGGQLELNYKLWSDIRANLQGEERNEMEGLRTNENYGYTELFTRYGEMSGVLDNKYEAELEKYVQSGDIDNEAKGKFMNDPDGIKNITDFQEKYHYIQELSNEIEKYKKSHEETDEANVKQTKAEAKRASDPLSIINSGATRTAIVETNLSLKKRGKEKQGTFLRRVKRMFINENKDNFDASGFQSRLKQNKEDIKERGDVQRKPEESNGADVLDFQSKLKASRRNNEEVDRAKVDEEMHELEQTGKAKTVDDHGFKQVETKANKERVERKTQVEINRDQAMDRFFTEDHRRQYKSKIEGGQDDLSLAVHTEDGRTVELNLTEIRAMEKYMEEDMQKVDEGESLDKAA